MKLGQKVATIYSITEGSGDVLKSEISLAHLSWAVLRDEQMSSLDDHPTK